MLLTEREKYCTRTSLPRLITVLQENLSFAYIALSFTPQHVYLLQKQVSKPPGMWSYLSRIMAFQESYMLQNN